MAELKTKKTGASVSDFINAIDDERRRKECKTVVSIMQKVTNAKPRMWGSSIVGFGNHEYTNSTGKPQEWFQCGFSPRKAALTLYLMGGYPKDAASLKKIGNVKPGGSCLYIKSLDEVNLKALQAAIADSLKRVSAGRVDYAK